MQDLEREHFATVVEEDYHRALGVLQEQQPAPPVELVIVAVNRAIQQNRLNRLTKGVL